MVPCIDMANHSSTPNAYYDENQKEEVVLLLRPKCQVSKSDEITITYGDQKSAAEMLFSYGFIDPESTTDSLVLPIEPFPDDPLAKAKLHIFQGAPAVHIRRTGDTVIWESPFAYLKCVNEEDGLEFRLLQDTTGNQQLRVFWQDVDVTDSASSFESLTEAHELRAIFQLRVVTVIEELLGTHLERMRIGSSLESALSQGPDLIRDDCFKQANLLREIETKILHLALENLEEQVS